MTAFSVTIPTVMVLPFCIWPICWMIVQLAKLDSKPSPSERILDGLYEPIWRGQEIEPNAPLPPVVSRARPETPPTRKGPR